MEHHLFVIYLLPPSLLSLSFLHFPLSPPLSCCSWLLVGVEQRQISRGDCLRVPVGNNSALLTLHYLALGYLNPLIYYGEHSVMISSTLDVSVWHSGRVRGAKPPPSLPTRQTHTWNTCTHTHIYACTNFLGCACVGTVTHTSERHKDINSLRYTEVDTCR